MIPQRIMAIHQLRIRFIPRTSPQCTSKRCVHSARNGNQGLEIHTEHTSCNKNGGWFFWLQVATSTVATLQLDWRWLELARGHPSSGPIFCHPLAALACFNIATTFLSEEDWCRHSAILRVVRPVPFLGAAGTQNLQSAFGVPWDSWRCFACESPVNVQPLTKTGAGSTRGCFRPTCFPLPCPAGLSNCSERKIVCHVRSWSYVLQVWNCIVAFVSVLVVDLSVSCCRRLSKKCRSHQTMDQKCTSAISKSHGEIPLCVLAPFRNSSV